MRVNLKEPSVYTGTPSRDLSGEWLVRIRWAAVLGQLLVYSTAVWGLAIPLSPIGILITSGIVVATNLMLLHPRATSLRERQGVQGAVLLLDVALLTAVLFAYGGYTNPFGMVYLVHVVIAALLLGGWWTWIVSLQCSLSYALLFRWYIPVPALEGVHHGAHGTSTGHDLHLHGMLLGFVLIAVLISGFLQRMRAEIEWREQELLKRRANEEKLAAVTAISASVAHELGTPLGSMMLVLDDLRDALRRGERGEAIGRDLTELENQIERCAEALRRVSSSTGELFGEMPQAFSLGELFAVLHRQFQPAEGVGLHFIAPPDVDELYLPREGLRHVLHGLVKNGVEACSAGGRVEVSAVGEISGISITVRDTGSGMSPAQLSQIGEPFFTTKDIGRGMGLGLFIAKLFAERAGGSLRILSTLGGGTTVTLHLPRAVTWERAA